MRTFLITVAGFVGIVLFRTCSAERRVNESIVDLRIKLRDTSELVSPSDKVFQDTFQQDMNRYFLACEEKSNRGWKWPWEKRNEIDPEQVRKSVMENYRLSRTTTHQRKAVNELMDLLQLVATSPGEYSNLKIAIKRDPVGTNLGWQLKEYSVWHDLEPDNKRLVSTQRQEPTELAWKSSGISEPTPAPKKWTFEFDSKSFDLSSFFPSKDSKTPRPAAPPEKKITRKPAITPKPATPKPQQRREEDRSSDRLRIPRER